jgi:hypothetical protein
MIAIADTQAALLAGRTLQGFAAAFAVPCTLAAVDSGAAPERRAAAVQVRWRDRLSVEAGGQGRFATAFLQLTLTRDALVRLNDAPYLIFKLSVAPYGPSGAFRVRTRNRR